MLGWRDRFSIRSFVFLDTAVTHKLFAGERMLPVSEPCKVHLLDASDQPELIGQLAMPFAHGPVVLFPVVLLSGREFFRVVRLGLRCRQRF
jgi:hypothetical protein